jgi:N-methylhydantoinase B
MAYQADQVTMQVIRYAMEQLADEMGYSLMRMSRTTIVKEILDFSCAVLDAQGNTIAQAHFAPMLMHSLETTTRKLLELHPRDYFREGDVFISNDPYMGGQHVMDVQFIAPVIFEGQLVGFVADIAHQLDMGGSVPGGVAGGLTEIYQEGLRLPPVKFCQEGREDPQIVSIIANNIRLPERTLGDFRAQVAATFVGVRRMKEIFAKYGLETVNRCFEMLLSYSESRMREGIRRIPDGDYTGVDYVDNDGHSDVPVRVQVNVHKRGDQIWIDFKGTSPQVQGNINCPVACSSSGIFYVLIAVSDPHVPVNAGCYRPIHIEYEEGTVVNPCLPAAVTARSQTTTKVIEALLKALARAVPDRVTAGSHGQASTCAFLGVHPDTGERFAYVEIQGGGGGARPNKDGPDGQDIHLGLFKNTPVEAAELEFPILVERYELIPDSGGAGEFRGGLSLRKDIRFLTDVTFSRYTDRQEFAPQGLFGGKEGHRGRLILNPGTPQEERLKSKGVSPLKKGDVLSIRLPGSGGYGDPRKRDPQLVRWDVLNGKVSLESARGDYLVVLNEDLTVDEEATAALRSRASAGLT